MNKNLLIGALCTISAAVGAVTGYFVAQKRLSHQFEEILQTEIEETKKYYGLLYKTGEFATIGSAAKTLGVAEAVEAKQFQQAVQAMRQYQGLEPVGSGKRNLFEDPEVLEKEISPEQIKSRTEEAPYIIGKEEFLQGEKSYVQVTVTYFAGDEVLIDEKEEVIEEVDMTVGLDNLQRFGQGSKDPRVVYVRNDALELEFEILKSDGKYSKEVLGFEG